MTSVHIGLTPDEFLHPMSGRNPRPTSFTPTWRCGNAELEAQPVSGNRCVMHGVLPPVGHVWQLLVDNLARPHRSQKALEALGPPNPDPFHPFEIESDPFLGDVAV